MSTNTLILTYWLIKPEVDLSEIQQIRELSAQKVYEPVFETGQRCMLTMHARFNADDPNAVMSAFLYLFNNAKRLAKAEVEGARIWGHECHMNGQKLSMSTQLT